ncbi:hydrolase-like motif protein [Ranid herpesvirus 3]|uniref:Hydrolase-like motif protein n=1 Tax=Ranid herpesvirus 3 TaxID=1987509 RepID=A0A1X9T575_9VIRU|nr:hydrolase-like motif protein [Ranid herpesvirus 3]ARR28852.1 hydrolase-like motif protein [Ranid herpesvirus 3]
MALVSIASAKHVVPDCLGADGNRSFQKEVLDKGWFMITSEPAKEKINENWIGTTHEIWPHVQHDDERCPAFVLFVCYRQFITDGHNNREIESKWHLNDMLINEFKVERIHKINPSQRWCGLVISEEYLKVKDHLRLITEIGGIVTGVFDHIVQDLTVPYAKNFIVGATLNGRYLTWETFIENQRNVEELRWFVNGCKVKQENWHEEGELVIIHIPWRNACDHVYQEYEGGLSACDAQPGAMLDEIALELYLEIVALDSKVHRFKLNVDVKASEFMQRNHHFTCETDIFRKTRYCGNNCASPLI